VTNRILDIAESPARLHVKTGLLVIDREDAGPLTVPLADLAALVVSHPRVSFTQAVLSGIAETGGSVVICDSKHMPAAMLLPLAGNSTQAERFAMQANATMPVRKRLWKQIVQAKLRAQARVLTALRGEDAGIGDLVSKVRSGDPTNVEAQAARRYWRALFEDEAFRRNVDADDQNRFLNYGYAVLRAIVARALVAAGLHPCLGLHHHNRYDAFCLADDFMEPYRPLVDRAVVRLCQRRGPESPLDREGKAALIRALTGRFALDGEQRTLFDILTRTGTSLLRVFGGQSKKLVLPEI